MQTKTSTSLFERLGGNAALDAAVTLFYEKVTSDPRVNSFFATTDLKKQRTKLKSFLAMAFGAKVKYTGKDLTTAHAHLVRQGLHEEHFIVVAQHLEQTLIDLQIPQPLIAEVMSIAAGTKDDVLVTKPIIQSTHMNPKNYYQEKGNGKPNSGAPGNASSSEELQKRIQELERIQRRNEQALEQAVDAVVTINADKIITFYNKAAAEMFGYTREEVMGQNVKMIVPMEHRAKHDNYVDSNIKTSVNKVVGMGRDLEMSRKDGAKFWGNLSLSKCDVDGEIQYTAFIKDVTDTKRKEEELKQAMEESRAQEEELRQTMEEITATQEEMERKQLEMEGQMAAINSTSAFIEFRPDGTVVQANDLFLSSMKYALKEIEGKHHRIFCDPAYIKTKEYEMFWTNLQAGKSQTGEFKRLAKDGSEVWLLASYTPVLDKAGQVVKVIKLATDITSNKIENANYQGQIEAIGKSQAVIEFNMDGTIISANNNFLDALGYSLKEIKGEHHQMFVDSAYAKSREYKEFWQKLNSGEYVSGEFKRLGKGGKEVWIQASYNPIMDLNDRPFKVVKYATDITNQKNSANDNKGQLDAVSRSNAVIEFKLDGTITHANENFLNVVGYSIDEIRGRHHRMFVSPEHSSSHEYKEMWAKLNRGEFVAGTFARVSKTGQEVFIQASYNPILDLNGVPVKIVKYATDITQFTKALKAVSKFTSELRDGNLDAELNVRAEGDLSKMIDDNLALRDTVRSILLDVNKVVRAAGEDGNLNARLNISNAKGAWKQMVDSVNLLLQSIAEPVMEFNKIITDMAKGDLTQRFQMSANGDIKNMANALNQAIDNLNELLYNIGKNADVVASSSMNMLQKTESMKRNTNEVASAISQMAKGAQDQAQRTDESSKLVEKVMGSANEMEKKANVINKAAEKGQKSSENGLKIMKTLVSNMTGIKDSAQQTSKSIDILTKRAEEIGRTLNVITDIASQTNLLALNAAIEAARAGDAGRGFAVVAEEIRKLAEDSRKSAVEIEKIIGDVQKDTQAAGKAIDTMQVSVKDGNVATNEAETIFQEIAKSSEETFSYSKEIQDATSGQKSSIDLVVKNIEQIVVVAEETAAGTQQAASSSQQMNNAMIEITDGTNKLTGVATELQTGLTKFKLRKAS